MNQRPTVTLRERHRKDGMSLLYLDIYGGSKAEIDQSSGKLKYSPIRERKSLNLTIFTNPKNSIERKANKEAKKLAEGIRYEEELRLSLVTATEATDLNTEVDFYDYYQDYLDGYFKKDKRHLTRALRLFQEYLTSVRKYRHYSKRIDILVVSKQMIEGYVDYLKSKFKGEGPHTVFARFKKVFKCAYEEGIIKVNPCSGVKVSCTQGQITKDTLTIEEIRTLSNTHYNKEKEVVRRAFLFCLYSGLRGCDVRHIKFSDVSVKDKTLTFYQQKTDGHSSESVVRLPLTDLHFALMGPVPSNKNDLIFKLPSDTTCNKELKRWMQAAQIDKHITWHCARHSFGTNLCEADINPMTIMRLMGHSHIKYTERYVRVRDKAKVEAMNVLVEGGL